MNHIGKFCFTFRKRTQADIVKRNPEEKFAELMLHGSIVDERPKIIRKANFSNGTNTGKHKYKQSCKTQIEVKSTIFLHPLFLSNNRV